MTRDELIEVMARGMCREKCAFMGEPPCFEMDGAWPPETCCEPGCIWEVTAALTALESAGMVVVPAEPTAGMIMAGLEADFPSASVYRAMIAARPAAQKENVVISGVKSPPGCTDLNGEYSVRTEETE